MKRFVGFELHNLYNLVKRELEKKLGKQDPVTCLHGWVIDYLCMHQREEVFQRDFEELFSMRRSTASRMLQLMEHKGLIVREAAPYDKRLRTIKPTPTAVQMHSRVQSARLEVESKLRRGITQEELDTFFQVVDKLKKNLE